MAARSTPPASDSSGRARRRSSSAWSTFTKGRLPGRSIWTARPTSLITAFLFHAGGHDDPERLHANAGKSFVGSYVLGMGFTFDDTDKKGIASPITRARADELAKIRRAADLDGGTDRQDPRNQERIFPYIGGEEVNDSPTQSIIVTLSISIK